MKKELVEKIIQSRRSLPHNPLMRKRDSEGGCGVIGIACNEKIAGKHLIPPLVQMRNRGNGKGGGIAAAGLVPEYFGVTQEILENNYLLTISFLDKACRGSVEERFIHPIFDVDHVHEMEAPVSCYFVRVKKELSQNLKTTFGPHLHSSIDDEIVYQNSYRLNHAFYGSTGEKKAFVLSHGKNLLVLKAVGYGDDVLRTYHLQDFKAHVWIGHHRYPTKGKVWHPGGAHPFIGLNEALVHNGDFANYYSMCEYLAQRNIHPLFLTDTEVAALLFDLLHRTYGYPLEMIFEALAPTTERDFFQLPKEKREIYQLIQKTHMHGSPDGPWFFLIAQSLMQKGTCSLIGITDTSMLRPQVFAMQEGAVMLGFSASEKQAIDAALKSLSEEDERIWPVADKYWSARGGSHTDGGAFVFTVDLKSKTLSCTDKFGNQIKSPTAPFVSTFNSLKATPTGFPDLDTQNLFTWAKKEAIRWDYTQLDAFLEALVKASDSDLNRSRGLEVISMLIDQRYYTRNMRHSCVLALLGRAFSTLATLPSLKSETQTRIINATDFPKECEKSLASEIVCAYKKGFKKILLVNCRGHRFIGAGLGPGVHDLRIDVYGSSGDYLASGIDGVEVHVHGNGQDQLAQIMKEGKLVVHGDVGQTFMYGAKGGCAYVLGNAAGRPLINAVGKTKAIINGTCLDYLAESFMAGDPLKGGGFVILNGLTFDDEGTIVEQNPYPGNNLFSLASGGVIYVRDPQKEISKAQLNGGEFAEMTREDWELIQPYLEENARLFNIPLTRLLSFKEKSLTFQEIYRKIRPSRIQALQEEEAWVKKANK